MHDRVALITGGGTGIGAATAHRLAAAGARAIICGRRAERLDATRHAIEAAGHRADAVVCDLETPGSAAELIDEIGRRWGSLDILVNNAALYAPQSALATDAALWARHQHLNVAVPFALATAAHALLAARRGVVVNVLSNLALRPVPGTAAYSASKAALASLTQTLALEWAAQGIRVVAVAVGMVATELHPPDRLEAMAPAHPLGRVGTPQEVAEAIHFLASDASAWTTGSILSVDGGLGLV